LPSPKGYNALPRSDDETAFSKVEFANEALAGQALRRVQLPAEVLIVAIRRGGEGTFARDHETLPRRPDGAGRTG
jgi:hypothetical protein